MQPVPPVGVAVPASGRRIAVELVHPVVPDQHVGVDVEVPDPDLGGVERQPEAARQPLELDLAVAQVVHVALALVDQAAGADHRADDQPAREQRQEPDRPDGRGPVAPAVRRRGGQGPVGARQRDGEEDRIAGQGIRGREDRNGLDSRGGHGQQGEPQPRRVIRQPGFGDQRFGALGRRGRGQRLGNPARPCGVGSDGALQPGGQDLHPAAHRIALGEVGQRSALALREKAREDDRDERDRRRHIPCRLRPPARAPPLARHLSPASGPVAQDFGTRRSHTRK